MMTLRAGSNRSISSGNDDQTLLVAHRESTLHGSDAPLKVRKPYTISKQREKWTEEEHQRFIDAIKLYGRAWPQIEEYVGTKTAVQIRSHAQKFFSKVMKEGSHRTERSTEPIEIPPPRPKRKPLHPYPRKFVPTPNKSTLCFSLHECRTSTALKTMERESHSPTSVLASEGSQILTSHAKNVEGGSAFSTTSGSNLSRAVDSSLIKDNSTVRKEKETDWNFSLTLNLSRTKVDDLTNMKPTEEHKDVELSTNKDEYLKSNFKFTPLKTIKLFGHTVVAPSPLGNSDSTTHALVHTTVTNLVTCSDPVTEPHVSIRSRTNNSIPQLALSLNGQLVADDIMMGGRKKSQEEMSSSGVCSTGLNRNLVIKVENPVMNKAYVHYTTEFKHGVKIYKREFLPCRRCASDKEVVPLTKHKDDRRNPQIYL